MKQFANAQVVQVLATKAFSRWMRKNDIHEQDLMVAVDEMMAGLIDADLGGHLFKKRLALQGRGKRSGARTIVTSRFGSRWIYLYGFDKSERANMDVEELRSLQRLAKILLNLTAKEVSSEVEDGDLIELGKRKYDHKAQKQNP